METLRNKYCPQMKQKNINHEVRKIRGEDINYLRLKNISLPPDRHISTVNSMTPAENIQYGTGILLSKNLVLTCAHAIYNKQHQAYDPRTVFYPGLCGEMEKWHLVQDCGVSEEYQTIKNGKEKGYDYALLRIKEQIVGKRSLELRDYPSEIGKNDTLSIFGYPVSKYETERGQSVGSKQYGLRRKGDIFDADIDAGYIIHRISAETGQSGAPVIKTDQNGKMTIVGLHLGSSEEYVGQYQEEFPDLDKVNLTKKLNNLIVRRFVKFADQLKGETFRIRAKAKQKKKEDHQIKESSITKVQIDRETVPLYCFPEMTASS